jgi:multidrug efflux pump subunit AcrA (membrane-fusion protein)
VWLIDPKTRVVNPTAITIDRYAGSDLVLSGGVTPGQTVVTAGIQFLYPGQIVDIATSEQAP